jgi:hypothetical protein
MGGVEKKWKTVAKSANLLAKKMYHLRCSKPARAQPAAVCEVCTTLFLLTCCAKGGATVVTHSSAPRRATGPALW